MQNLMDSVFATRTKTQTEDNKTRQKQKNYSYKHSDASEMVFTEIRSGPGKPNQRKVSS